MNLLRILIVWLASVSLACAEVTVSPGGSVPTVSAYGRVTASTGITLNVPTTGSTAVLYLEQIESTLNGNILLAFNSNQNNSYSTMATSTNVNGVTSTSGNASANYCVIIPSLAANKGARATITFGMKQSVTVDQPVTWHASATDAASVLVNVSGTCMWLGRPNGVNNVRIGTIGGNISFRYTFVTYP